MADYSELTELINSTIYTNGEKSINAASHNGLLHNMVTSFSEGYLYSGLADLTTNPLNTDSKKCYITSTAGVYVNFSNIEVEANSLVVLKGSGTTWTSDILLSNIDNGGTGIVAAHMSNPLNTSVTLTDRWYIFQSEFENTVAINFTLESDGITYVGEGGYFEVEWMAGGVSNKACDIKIGIVKNGTFVEGLLDSGENILAGSGGKDFADTVGAPNGEVNPRSFWSGYLNTGDKLTLVIAATTSGVIFIPDEASASLHSIK